jgi:Domain of unknown function (DUF6984)
MSRWRRLRKEEAELIAAIVRDSANAGEIVKSLPTRLVQDMTDGGMGSVRFKSKDDSAPRFGSKIGEAEFTDADGVPVSVVINLDADGALFELDMWKADFSPLKRYPAPRELQVKTIG